MDLSYVYKYIKNKYEKLKKILSDTFAGIMLKNK